MFMTMETCRKSISVPTIFMYATLFCCVAISALKRCELGQFPSEYVDNGCTPCPNKIDNCEKQGEDKTACLNWCRLFTTKWPLTKLRTTTTLLPKTRTTVDTSKELEDAIRENNLVDNQKIRKKIRPSVAEIVVIAMVSFSVSVIAIAVVVLLRMRSRSMMNRKRAGGQSSESDKPSTVRGDNVSMDENQKGSANSANDKVPQLHTCGNCVQETQSTELINN
ncbi:uncharacterized protein LOC124437672 isoform X2 [Xenia sp. Carnegie-2017]|uniref:uncharacterized protein LOC124437672 isoform X2 n=1 Tax=Xenia sp. Carnegie-2017 TaxID=2897299 RepID=UPI001F039E49|nr:uncharacterized protein LOC124437672 isoform X2 [Xenia sp. Carnegie-2017]